jgi:hypothetical protein
MVMATPIGYDKVRKVHMKISKLKRSLYLSKLTSHSTPRPSPTAVRTVPQNPESPRGSMTFNKFTRDVYGTVCLFPAHAPQSVIIATFCRHNVITCPESPDYHFLYVSQHFNSLFVHVHPGLHLETGQSSTTAAVHLVFRPTIGFLDLHNFTCASL